MRLMSSKSPALLRARADEIEKQQPQAPADHLMSFSKWVVAGVMLMFFVGVWIGCYAVLNLNEPVQTVLNFISPLVKIAFLGYFIKAFGENIAKIALPFIFGNKNSDGGSDEQ